MTVWPDRYQNTLPTRAYLSSVLSQTVPARRAALADSVRHFHDALASGDRGWADMALLGAIADSLQLLEDLAYVGEAFTAVRFPGLPFYVAAITYGGNVPTTFYTRKRTNEDLRVLAGFAVREPDGTTHGVLEMFHATNLSESTKVAWAEAEETTVTVVRATIDGLADTWKRFGKYAHGFKHGGLVPNRDDFQLVDDNGKVLDPVIAVWMRKKSDPHAHGHTKGDIDVADIVRELEISAAMAIDVLDVIVSIRLGLADYAASHEPGSPDELMRMSVPVRFKLGQLGLSDEATRELEAIGLTFSDVQVWPPRSAVRTDSEHREPQTS